MILCVFVHMYGSMGCYMCLFMLKVVRLLTIVGPFGCGFVHSEGCGSNCNCARVECMFKG